jgi:pentose-5-phosphate-3-epimerase
MIHPSILEYSSESLIYKLKLILKHKYSFQKLANQDKSGSLFIHLDIVAKYFAQSRFVMKSINFETVFKNILQLELKNTVFSTHFMTLLDDQKVIWKALELLNLHQKELKTKNVKFIFYLSESLVEPIQSIIKQDNLGSILKLGIWYDKDEWIKELESLTKNDNHLPLLLMTVPAGKSGQKLNNETLYFMNSLLVSQNYKSILIDGGINFKNVNLFKKQNRDNKVDFVSYNAFWQKFY